MRTHVTLLLSALLVLAAQQTAHAQAKSKRPNIIIFLSDDVGYAEYGFQGSKDI